jgi:hypothetical protein
MKIKFLIYFLSIVLLFSCEKDAVVSIGKGNFIEILTSDASSVATSTAVVGLSYLDSKELINVKSQGVCYSLTPKPTLSNPFIVFTSQNIGPGKFSGTISGLEPNKRYYLRSFLILSSTNLTIYGDEKSLVTQPQPTLNDGKTATTAGTSAVQIKTNYPSSQDGVYWINLPTVGPTQIYCIMNTLVDGGGWMMIMKARKDLTTFQYGSTYWTVKNSLNSSDLNRNVNDAKFNSMNYFLAKDMLALWPDIASNVNNSATGGSINLRTSYNNWVWLQNDFNNGARIAPVDFWNNVSNKFIMDANIYAGRGLAFSSQTDVRFYGYNYNRVPGARVRWGFAWNENGGGVYPNGIEGSNDVSGGIGLDANFLNYSAGDVLQCCSNGLGINRSASVELYVR